MPTRHRSQARKGTFRSTNGSETPFWKLLEMERPTPGARLSGADLQALALDEGLTWSHQAIPYAMEFLERVARAWGEARRVPRSSMPNEWHFAAQEVQSALVDMPDVPLQALHVILKTHPPAGTLCRLGEHPNATIDLWRALVAQEDLWGGQLCFSLADRPEARADLLVSQAILSGWGTMDGDPVRAVLQRAGSREPQFRGERFARLVREAPFGGPDGLFAHAVRSVGHLAREVWDLATPDQRAAVTPAVVAELLTVARGVGRETLLTCVVPTLTP